MAIANQHPFTPVRAPKVRPPAKPPLSLTALKAFEKCQRREEQLRSRNWIIFLGGIAAMTATLMSIPFGVFVITRHLKPPPPFMPIELQLPIDAALLIITCLIAVFTRPKSRADVANVFLDSGNRCPPANDNPLIRWIVILILLGLLYGEYLVIDAIKLAWVQRRLHQVDRHRAAVVLGMLLQNPAGLDPRLLLQQGESPLHLRQLIAYLVINEWADVSPHGNTLTLVGPGRRALRGYHVHGR